MQVRGSSLHNRGATTIRTDYTHLGIPYHTTYAGPRSTYINPHSDPQKRERVRAAREHSTPLPYAVPDGIAWWVHATLTISPLPVRIVCSHNGIAEVLGLPKYVASCKVSTTTGLQ
jgi:hypothetical protein